MAVHPVVSIAILPFQRCIGGLLTQNRHGERSIRRLVNSTGFSRFRAGSRRAIGIPPTKSGGGGFLCLGVVRHGPGLPTNVFLNRISRVLAGGGYCRLWGVSRFWQKWPAQCLRGSMAGVVHNSWPRQWRNAAGCLIPKDRPRIYTRTCPPHLT